MNEGEFWLALTLLRYIRGVQVDYKAALRVDHWSKDRIYHQIVQDVHAITQTCEVNHSLVSSCHACFALCLCPPDIKQTYLAREEGDEEQERSDQQQDEQDAPSKEVIEISSDEEDNEEDKKDDDDEDDGAGPSEPLQDTDDDADDRSAESDDDTEVEDEPMTI
jgi:hypothetical protein